jgi:hypothetical protein
MFFLICSMCLPVSIVGSGQLKIVQHFWTNKNYLEANIFIIDNSKNMSFKISIIVLLHLTFLSPTITLLTVYNNARFDPIDRRYMISILSSISSVNACLCECYNNIICFTANYFAINHTCFLYFAQLNPRQLWVVPTIMNGTVYGFGNRSLPGTWEEHTCI